MIKLREYQENAVRSLLSSYEDSKRSCVVSPTGSGKTIMIREFVKRLNVLAPDIRIGIAVHRIEILKTIEDLVSTIDNFDDIDIEFSTIQKLNRVDKVFDVLIIDEAHHVTAKSYRKIIKENCNWHCGFTATPIRGLMPEYPSFMPIYKDTWKTELTGLVSEELFDNFILTVDTASLINDGFLCDYKIIHDYKFRIRHKGSPMQDYSKKEVDKAITPQECANYILNTLGSRKAIVFCHSIESAESLSELLGEQSVAITSKTPRKERMRLFSEFKKRAINILIGVDVFSEGIDVPDTDCVYLFRPTRSIPLYFQQIGRALRVAKGKRNAIVYDYVNNYERLGVEPKDVKLQDMLLPTKFSKETCEFCGAYGVIESENDKKCSSVPSIYITELSRWIKRNYSSFYWSEVDSDVAEIKLRKTSDISESDLKDYKDKYHGEKFKLYNMPIVLNPYGRWEVMNSRNKEYATGIGSGDVLELVGRCKHSQEKHMYFLCLDNLRSENHE